MDKKAIRAKLIKLRGSKTQAETAEMLGIAQSTYAMYETGDRIPGDETKIKIANLYRKTVQFIFFT